MGHDATSPDPAHLRRRAMPNRTGSNDSGVSQDEHTLLRRKLRGLGGKAGGLARGESDESSGYSPKNNYSEHSLQDRDDKMGSSRSFQTHDSSAAFSCSADSFACDSYHTKESDAAPARPRTTHSRGLARRGAGRGIMMGHQGPSSASMASCSKSTLSDVSEHSTTSLLSTASSVASMGLGRSGTRGRTRGMGNKMVSTMRITEPSLLTSGTEASSSSLAGKRTNSAPSRTPVAAVPNTVVEKRSFAAIPRPGMPLSAPTTDDKMNRSAMSGIVSANSQHSQVSLMSISEDTSASNALRSSIMNHASNNSPTAAANTLRSSIVNPRSNSAAAANTLRSSIVNPGSSNSAANILRSSIMNHSSMAAGPGLRARRDSMNNNNSTTNRSMNVVSNHSVDSTASPILDAEVVVVPPIAPPAPAAAVAPVAVAPVAVGPRPGAVAVAQRPPAPVAPASAPAARNLPAVVLEAQQLASSKHTPTEADWTALYNKHVEVLERKDMEIAMRLSARPGPYDNQRNNGDDDRAGLDLAMQLSRAEATQQPPAVGRNEEEEERMLQMVLEMSRNDELEASFANASIGSGLDGMSRDVPLQDVSGESLLGARASLSGNADVELERVMRLSQEQPQLSEEEELERVLRMSQEQTQQEPPLNEEEELERVLRISQMEQQQQQQQMSEGSGGGGDDDDELLRVLQMSQQEATDQQKERETMELVLRLSRQDTCTDW